MNLTRLLTIHCAHIYSRATNVSQVISELQEDRIWRRFSVTSPLDQVSFDALPLDTPIYTYNTSVIHNISVKAYLLSKVGQITKSLGSSNFSPKTSLFLG